MFMGMFPESADHSLFRAHCFLQLFIKANEFRLIASTKDCKLRFRQFLQLLKGLSDFSFQFGIFFTSHALCPGWQPILVLRAFVFGNYRLSKTGGFLSVITKMM